MWAGTSYALAAGLMWGLVFVGPLLLPEYPAALQSVARYLAFGLIAMPLAWLDRKALRQLSRADWIEALKLAAIGNLLYYLCLASAIQRAGGPVPTMIIGTLPVVIAICANLRNARRDGRLPWKRLAPSLVLIALGIACVNQVELQALHQEIALCGDATVAENLFMPHINTQRGAWMDYAGLNRRAREVLRRLGQDIDPGLRVDQLGISSQQLVEIARALTLDCKVLILDEPTAALTEVESAALFRVLHGLKAQGIGIIYISHRMAEIFAHCDRVTVLRDGRDVHCGALSELTPDALVRRMVGRDLGNYYPPRAANSGQPPETVLQVTDLDDGARVHGISFTLRRGEILGISGLMGAGRTELAETVCGLRRARRGSVSLRGQPLRLRRYADALRHGIAYLSEDRKAAGLFLDMPIERNVSSMALARVSGRFGLLRRAAERRLATDLGARLKLKAAGVDQDASCLSGGNQQKVAIAKLLATRPAVLLMDEPTRGVDVGAKSEIHHLLRELADQGVGVVVISSELPEIIGLCDRALVIHNGTLAGELAAADMTEEKLLRLASGLGAQETP